MDARRARALAALLAATAASSGCRSDPDDYARALTIDNMNQLIGGPAASGQLGDHLLDNGRIRAVVETARRSVLPLQMGGTLVDLDLARPDDDQRGGAGGDLLGQIVPIANLYASWATMEGTVRITRTKDGAAEVTVSAKAEAIQKTLDALGILVERHFAGDGAAYSRPWIYSEYRLEPGARLLRIVSKVAFDVKPCPVTPADGCNPECDDAIFDSDCDCPVLPARCDAGSMLVDADPLPTPEGPGLLDVLLGDLPRPIGTRCDEESDCDVAEGESCVRVVNEMGGDARVCRGPQDRDAGVMVGDMLLFNGPLRAFVDGPGFDAETVIRSRFDVGMDTLSVPIVTDSVFAIGDGVSYGYAARVGKVLVPIFSGAFSLGAVGAAACRHSDPECLDKTIIRFERLLSVGAGDTSSAAEPLLQARGRPFGVVEGYVVEDGSGARVSGAEIYAIRDPATLACDAACQARGCPALPDGDAEATLARARCMTVTEEMPEGDPGVVAFALTDPSDDRKPDGSYRLVVEPGRYLLVAVKGYATSAPVPVELAGAATRSVSFLLPQVGTLAFQILDEGGRPIAGRVTVGRCFPTEKSCRTDAECGAGTLCQAGTCSCAWERLRPLELGGSRYVDGSLAFAQTHSGGGTLDLPPGAYDLIFSHGPEYTTDRKSGVVIERGAVTRAVGQVARAVDREGWSAADFHVHSFIAGDGVATLPDRVTSFLAEGLDFLSSADHDHLTWYGPILRELGVEHLLSTQVGDEVSTLEIGHFLGFPLRYEEWGGEPRARLAGNGAPTWAGMFPQQLFDAIRGLSGDRTPAIVGVPHPYSYFDAYMLDPVSMEPTETLMVMLNPLISPEAFSGDFDVMELLNGKGFDNVRRPTLDEIRYYSAGLDALLAGRASGELDEEAFRRAFYAHSTETVRRYLHRTKAEQDDALAGVGNDLKCLCGSDGDCAAGTVCNLSERRCVMPPVRGMPSEPPPNGLCRSVRGVVDDWFTMMNRGVYRTGISNSDVHGLYVYEAGSPRTLVWTGETKVPHLGEELIADSLRAGRAIVSNGPMVHFTIDGAGIGDELPLGEGGQVELRVRVEKAPWYDVDRVEIYRNGELIHWATACDAASTREGDEEDPDGHPCVAVGETALAWEDTIPDQPPRDAWYVVIALGIDHRVMSPVYSSVPLSRLGTTEISQRIYDLVPVLAMYRIPRYPSLFPTFPLAITNPVWVDVGGDGWTPPLPAPSWCRPGDRGCR